MLAVVSLALPVNRVDVRAQGGCTPAVVMSPGGAITVDRVARLSGDGRYMAFSSAAANLVPGDANGADDIFVFDRVTCAVERVSVSSEEAEGNSRSRVPSISLDGRFVAFTSEASNLVPGPDSSGYDVFVRDRLAGLTVRVSSALDGGASNSVGPETPSLAISGNGQFVAFWSNASNLIVGDTNDAYDVFVRDVSAGVTTRASVATGGVQATGNELPGFDVLAPAISEDGRYVAFSSNKANLVPDDTNFVHDVFRHDRQTGITTRVSVSAGGGQLAGHSMRSAMSRDGLQIAFDTDAAGVITGDTNGATDVFVRDVLSGTTTRVSQASHGGEVNGDSWAASLSGDGRYVAFSSDGNNVAAGDSNPGFVDLYVHDRVTGIVRRVNASAGGVAANEHSEGVQISDNGAFVSFASFATNLGPPDADAFRDFFLTDWRSVPVQPFINILRNFLFSNGLDRWRTFALPEPDDIVWNTTGSVLQFYRETGSAQAVVLQGTGGQLPAFAPLIATFALGNSSASRKRISALIHDGDFGDLSVCTFWLDPGAPMRQYEMWTHTTRAWSDATISFYAATADSTGFYRVDTVSLTFNPDQSASQTVCVDPTAPTPDSSSAGPNLIINGSFTAGQPPWGTFGQIVSQVADGVFEFYRPAGTPAGVVQQATGQAFPTTRRILTATFRLGNSSGVRKRATVLVHDVDFSDLSACTFWLPPGLPLSSYTMAMFTTKQWANATLSVYGATIGTDPWIRLDDVVLQHTQGQGAGGTRCIEPDLSEFVSPGPANASAADALRRSVVASRPPLQRTTPAPRTPEPATVPRVTLQFWVPPHDGPLEVQVRPDGDAWMTVLSLEPSDEWRLVELGVTRVAQVRLRPVGSESPF